MQQKHRTQRCHESHRCRQRDGPSPHTSQPHCAAHKYRRILCARLHTELAALHCSTPYFLPPDLFAAPLYQHYPNSPNPGLSICGILEQVNRVGALGPCCSSVLRFPCTRTPEFLPEDGKLAFTQHRSRGTSLTQALKSWFPLICMSCESPFLGSRRRDLGLPSGGSFV